MHTPRLCIDGRAASEFSSRGLMAQEVIDQLVSAQFEPDTGSEWLEKQRTVLLSHPGQVFTGQLKRFDTKMAIRRSPVHWIWETNFVRNAQISAFHRFRPVDRLAPYPSCASITTLLPPRRRLPFFLSHRSQHVYVVPSLKEARFIERSYRVPSAQVAVVRPGVRRYVHFLPAPVPSPEGWLLILLGSGSESKPMRRWMKAIAERFPELPRRIVRLKNRTDLSPLTWLKLLQNTKVCVYLTAKHFDWPALALESIFYGVPTVFAEAHSALSELLPQSPLSASHFLLNQPDLTELKKLTEAARQSLFQEGVFRPLAQAKQYRYLYQNLGG